MSKGASSGSKVERLLEDAHARLPALHEQCGVMQRSGIGSNHLPDNLALMAFALLGDHDRSALLRQLRGYWTGLQDKGFARGSIDEAPTAELRLLAHVLEHTDTVGPILQQLRDAEGITQPPREIWRCVRQITGLWGQKVQVHFSVLGGVSHLLIDADPVFGLQPALLAVNPDAGRTGTFCVPVDEGAIRITLLHRSGLMFRHIVQATVEGVS